MGLLDGTTQQAYYDGSDFGGYQFITLDDIINSFMVVYVGENKILTKVSRTDVQFHGMRAIQELSYDVLKSMKSQEIEVPPSLKMMLPQDYVNYCKLVRVDSNGIEKPLYPTGKTSNPFAIQQASDGTYSFSGSASSDYRKITITCPDYDTLVDGEAMSITYDDESGVAGHLWFVWTKDNDNENSQLPLPSDDNPRFVISPGPGDTSATQIAVLLKNSLNNTLRFTATSDGAVVTILYKYIKSSYGEVLWDVGGSTDDTTFTKTILSSGATSINDNIQYQDESDTWDSFSTIPTSNSNQDSDDVDYPRFDNRGRRYGLDPQYAQTNGTFYIDDSRGFIHFGSNLAGETIILKYISDGLGTDAEMLVHKFAEEAVYKHIMYGLVSGRTGIPEYITQRFKKEKFAETRKAKIRLSNIKMEEFTQVLRGLSKPIK